MNILPRHGRTWALLAVGAVLLVLLAYVMLRSGPLSPVDVVLARVEQRAITPARYGIGTVEARHTYKIGPTFAGRVKRLDVDVGQPVRAGQLLGEMEPVDLDDRLGAQEAAVRRAEAALREAEARERYARAQVSRYEELLAARATSEETAAARRQDWQVADAGVAAAREEYARANADLRALTAQRHSLRLVAPVAGLIAARDADPGTTVVAGQSVVEVIDPRTLWINVRFDQISAAGLAPGLPARILLRSRGEKSLPGRLARLEPKADPVTEEVLAKVAFDGAAGALPPVGELAEVTVQLPRLPAAPVIPNAAISRDGGRVGVWRIVSGKARFTPVRLGAADLEGMVEVVAGLTEDDLVVMHSAKALTASSRIRIVDQIGGMER